MHIIIAKGTLWRVLSNHKTLIISETQSSDSIWHLLKKSVQYTILNMSFFWFNLKVNRIPVYRNTYTKPQCVLKSNLNLVTKSIKTIFSDISFNFCCTCIKVQRCLTVFNRISLFQTYQDMVRSNMWVSLCFAYVLIN